MKIHMLRSTLAVTEKQFRKWKHDRQQEYLKQHPNSKFAKRKGGAPKSVDRPRGAGSKTDPRKLVVLDKLKSQYEKSYNAFNEAMKKAGYPKKLSKEIDTLRRQYNADLRKHNQFKKSKYRPKDGRAKPSPRDHKLLDLTNRMNEAEQAYRDEAKKDKPSGKRLKELLNQYNDASTERKSLSKK